ncbi:hypothetical protein P691DRAFT_810330 [Macrolepiota fuliginosa MF-IS2]|uniref:Nephrocystin 3-like N-terminal domain-containing protein n=1 Tax=Macrolepiota fuliginosa MF-IS2 TaxID=1400762 RepID=A0A9P5X0P8_9AGAR|nr:hypothetical protein P691DRAFT_810330 [Macrolepiota fuliginosa MF-IS2]
MSRLSTDTRINKDTPARQSSRTQTKRKTSILSNAHDFVISSLTQVDKSQINSNNTQININNGTSKGSGLRILLEKSIPGASLDSSDRDPPPRCHPGTRTEYIKNLTTWGRNADSHPERIAWLKGLAAVGKSAIAQTCAEDLGDKLAAAFFFSRPNHRDKYDRFFTSISHQLAVKYDSFGDIVDSDIIRNPTLVDKALSHQFHNLIVNPIQRLKREGKELPELVIVVDGLDECADAKAQETIIKIIAQSVQKQTTPFLWIILSRPERHLEGAFNTPEVKSITLPIELPVSREVDGDIAMFLTAKLKETAQKHPQLPSPWPSEQEVWEIVDLSDGLFACAEAVSRFIDDDDSPGPEVQLHDVLRLAREHSAQKGRGNSSTGLDGFYTLVMERVPPKQLQTVLWIFLVVHLPYSVNAIQIAGVLGLSESQFRNAFRSLHSVITITDEQSPKLYDYHASFTDFLEDPARSKRFWIKGDCAVTLLTDVLIPRYNKVQVNDKYIPGLSSAWGEPSPVGVYVGLGRVFFELLISVDLGVQKLRALNDFDFRKATLRYGLPLRSRSFPQRLEFIRRATLANTLRSDQWGIWFKSLRRPVYVVGHGEKKSLFAPVASIDLCPQPYSKRSNQKLLKQMREESPGAWEERWH